MTRSTDIIRHINGYKVETAGGFITVKRWLVHKHQELMGVFFSFRKAKEACENNNFTNAIKKDIY